MHKTQYAEVTFELSYPTTNLHSRVLVKSSAEMHILRDVSMSLKITFIAQQSIL